jgi:hypothetical protein
MLAVRPSIARFLVPLGATVNMNGTALNQGLATEGRLPRRNAAVMTPGSKYSRQDEMQPSLSLKNRT